ncbi:hypothetical protein ACHAWX_002381 [Stephanocyclus meneghinianus]
MDYQGCRNCKCLCRANGYRVVIVRPGAQCLNSQIPQSLKNYNKSLEEMIERHRLSKKLQQCFDPGMPRKREWRS